jgi:hypothetical protein
MSPPRGVHKYDDACRENSSDSSRLRLDESNYQAGISFVDVTDPAAAREIALCQPPAALVPTQLGGDWSTYWYKRPNLRVSE